MIPVYPVDTIRKADAETIRRQGISSWQLMERAARACFDFLFENEPEAFDPASSRKPKFVIFCGRGNNGGDGFALARMRNGTRSCCRKRMCRYGFSAKTGIRKQGKTIS